MKTYITTQQIVGDVKRRRIYFWNGEFCVRVGRVFEIVVQTEAGWMFGF